jgi:hypothetical protein
VASKTGIDASSVQALEEALDVVDQTLDRLKTMYEQYFLGIQKQAPAFLHSDVERKLRDLTQVNMRNTGLRYRLATLQQKFGSYNSYWRRTLRQIENGTYIRNLAKIGREAAKNGSHIPEEILAAMPKRMREQVLRDRDAAIAIAKRRKLLEDGAGEDELDAQPDANEAAAIISESSALKHELKTKTGAHVLTEDDGEMDFDAFFSAFEDDAPKPEKKPALQTQQITMPIGRIRPDTEQDLTLEGEPAPPTQAMPILPRGTTPTAMPTSAIAKPGVPPRIPAPGRPTGAIPRPPQTGPVPAITDPQATTAIPRPAGAQPSGPTTAIPRPIGAQSSSPTSAIPRPIGAQPSSAVPTPQRPTPSIPVAGRQTGPVPVDGRRTGPIPTLGNASRDSGPVPSSQRTQPIPKMAPASQASRPNPVAPGAAAKTGPVGVESMSGPFPRAQPPAPSPPASQQPRPQPAARPTPTALKPPPGMTEADVNALHAKYVKAKEMVGEKVDAGSREKLLKTITQTAPKIMEQYKASGVDFSVVVKDNQVVIKAKPKT